MLETADLTEIKGIGPKSAQNFARAGIHTVGDLVRFYPRSYDAFEDPVPASELSEKDEGHRRAVRGKVEDVLKVRYVKKNYALVTGQIAGEDGALLHLVWFNMPYLKNQLKPGQEFIFRGQIHQKGKQLSLEMPKIYSVSDYTALQRTLQPVYPLTQGLTENALRKALKEVFYGERPLRLQADPLPDDLLKKYRLCPFQKAAETIHFPEDQDSVKAARGRFVFDEFFTFSLMLQMLRERRMGEEKAYPLPESKGAEMALKALPYELTQAQKRVWEEISGELRKEAVCARLVQGDVGSGKTIIAFLALIQAAEAGYQGCLMVPTEVLARQHFEGFSSLCRNAGLRIPAVLLTGSLKAKEKREALEKIVSGEAKVVIGTHALFQEKVAYQALGLVVTDEQHRFGVKQREALAGKADRGEEEAAISPHTIVMSATPIPRTLAVILYGDLDISVIDELPASRVPIKNAVLDKRWRGKADQLIAREVKKGHQGYVICPMVEESEEIDAENVIDYADSLRTELGKYLPDVSVEYLHGRMKAEEKNDIMERFSSGKIQVLVSTTVVEVGVNVPNATVMMIENSERFGLAQLHQLRGRVGRGKDQSYCIFMYSAGGETIRKRLEILENSNDGFEIASKDLELRGPGELFGVRQSGEVAFNLADPFTDAALMQEASEAAAELLQRDPRLELPEHLGIRKQLEDLREKGMAHLSL